MLSESTAQRSQPDEAEIMLRTLSVMVEPLTMLMPGRCEVALHDLRLLPNSIVAIAGELTGRRAGGPATDSLLRAGARNRYETKIGYPSNHPDGSELRSSTIIFRDTAGTAVAALCVNCETQFWRQVHDIASAMLPQGAGSGLSVEHQNGSAPSALPVLSGEEEFPGDIDELAESLLQRALASVDIPVELMHKRHKLRVVQDLNERGFFLLKESVETAAQALGVTRFTIYNYLKN